MFVFLLWASIFAFLFYYATIKPLSYWKEKGIKHTNPMWLLGDTWRLPIGKTSFSEIIQGLYEMFPNERYFGMHQFTVPVLFIRDPELVKQITVKDFDHFVDHREMVSEDADPLWGKNLFSLRGQRWKEMRPVLSPSFTSSKMRLIFVLMTECAETFVEHFLNKDEDKVDVDMMDTLKRFATDVIASSAFGLKVDSLADTKHEFFVMGQKATNLNGVWNAFKFFGYTMFPKLFQVFKLRILGEEVSKFFFDLINDTVKIREEKGIVRPDMIHLLMEARKGKLTNEESLIDTGFATALETTFEKSTKLGDQTKMTITDIAAQAMIFFFAGFETTATLMSFMALELAINPDIQDRLRREIELTTKECEGKPSYEALMRMKYMDMVVTETLRKWPNATIMDRVCTKPYVIKPTRPEEERLILDTGDQVWIPLYGFHRDPMYYPEPEKFDPERFSEENRTKVDPYAYLPFGAGPRNCIGSRFALMETKVIFFYLLNSFEIVPTEKTKIPIKISKKSFMLGVEGGFHLRFKRLTSIK